MKSQKGVALTSVIVYIIIMLVVISIISVITTFFYNNVEEVGKDVDPSQEFTRFTSFFIDDINKTNTEIKECSENGEYIILSDGTQYTFANNAVYRDKVKVCDGVENVTFEYENNEEGKNIVNVKYKLTKNTEEKTTKFTIG